MNIATLPRNLYLAEQISQGERLCAQKLGISMYQLMERAGHSVFEAMLAHYPELKKVLVVCGSGNNGGDGYVVARLALQSGIEVVVASLNLNEELTGDSQIARQAYVNAGGQISDASKLKLEDFQQYSVIVDALIGTGLKDKVTGKKRKLIQIINSCPADVIAVDLPSGLLADSGVVVEDGIEADITVTFIGLKLGQFVADGPDVCGKVIFSGLDIEQQFADLVPATASFFQGQQAHNLYNRKQNSHKGSFGHLVCVGGGKGMAGAVFMAAKSALRSGVGKVSVITHPDNVALITSLGPEVMVHGFEGQELDTVLINKIHLANAIVIGPGLGSDTWAQVLFSACKQQLKHSKAAVLLDADGLNILSLDFNNWEFSGELVLTPHPLEAARLLASSTAEICQNRLQAAQLLASKYKACIVLKGCGSLVADHHHVSVNGSGNPGMATAGMGDVLSGVIAANLANQTQLQVCLHNKVKYAVYLHGLAGDFAAKNGEVGIIATDVIEQLPKAISHLG